MANKEDHLPRGNEWEVVSLTSSAYAAAPLGPYNVDAYYKAEASRDLFMSDHFVFPPSEHENLPLDDSLLETEEEKDGHEFQDESALSSSRQMESLGSESSEHGLIDTEPDEFAEEDLDLHSDTATRTLRLGKDAKRLKHNLPCEAWWRRREANAIWSLFFAAAVTGLVVFGQRWQQERWQVLQLKWQSSISSEKLSRVLEPLSRLKEVIVRGNPQASLIRSGSSSEIKSPM